MRYVAYILLFLFCTVANASDVLYKFMPKRGKILQPVLVLTDEPGSWCPPHAPEGVPEVLHWKKARLMFPSFLSTSHMCWIMVSKDTVTVLRMETLDRLNLDVNKFIPVLGH